MDHGRLPWLRPVDLDPAQRVLYDRVTSSFRAASTTIPLLDEEGRLNGPFNPMLTSPGIGVALEELGRALRSPGTLPRLVFESVVIMCASSLRASYEWYAHAPLAREAGLSEEQVHAVFRGDFERLAPTVPIELVRLVVASLAHTRPADEDVAAVRSLYGAGAVTEVIVTIGHYHVIAMLMSVWDCPMPHDVPDPFAGAAPRASE
jgi:4-carboxymuconolactone decarboxylase